ncbi:hypothetical protein [Caulobacter sp. NIBR2454]|uniref:hypothetical protein n=1 Tax=Caulobacter sp. NIBR2454 TaxID=3015996 RepID=UPI0022B61C66|nr:hypothetical protein [Caulobacter sp. NIBR2454]
MIVWCAAGPELGVGHLSRCATLCQALVAAGEQPVLLVEAAADYDGFFDRAGCPVMRVAGRAQAWAFLEGRGGVLVTDLLGLSKRDSDRARALGLRPLVHINDSLGDYGADLLIDTDVTPSAVAPAGVRLLAGAEWHMVRPDVAAARPASPWSGERAARVLLTFGGADPALATEVLAAGLAEAPFAATAALGPAMPRARKDALRADTGRVSFIEAPEDMAELILAHDLVVTLGGLTSYEAMVLGRPTACVSWRNMTPYVARLASAGVAADLGPLECAAPALLALAEDGAKLSALAAAGFEALDGRGAVRVAQVLRRMAEDVR